MKKIVFIALAILLMQHGVTAQNNAAATVKIDSVINVVMRDWKIPGMAVAFIKDGKVIHQKGFGTKSPEAFLPVDENTVFQIGSVSKSFTAALVAMLVDEGKLKWNDKVIDHLPDFKMYDSLAAKSLLVRDVMTHRSGLREQAGTYIPNLGYDRNDIYRLFQYIKPATELRSAYAYNNITFVIAAKLIEKYTGKSWEQNVRERIFEPLGMNHSSVNEEGFEASANKSMSCEFDYDGGINNKWLYGSDRALYWLTVVGPAGSINSTAADLVKWSAFHLNKGKVGDSTIISENSMKYLHTGQLITSMDSARITAYGQCWFIEQTNRYRLYFHTGTTWGFTTLCAFVPEINLGMVILANSESPAAPRYTIMRSAIDLFKYGNITEDYHADMFGSFIKKQEERAKKAKEEFVFVAPLQSLDEYVDKYHNDILGDAEIKIDKGKLFITIARQGWTSELKHISGDKFEFRMQGHNFPVQFTLTDDKVSAFNIDFSYEEDFGEWVKNSHAQNSKAERVNNIKD